MGVMVENAAPAVPFRTSQSWGRGDCSFLFTVSSGFPVNQRPGNSDHGLNCRGIQRESAVR